MQNENSVRESHVLSELSPKKNSDVVFQVIIDMVTTLFFE